MLSFLKKGKPVSSSFRVFNVEQEGFRAVDSLCKSGSQLGEREDLVT